MDIIYPLSLLLVTALGVIAGYATCFLRNARRHKQSLNNKSSSYRNPKENYLKHLAVLEEYGFHVHSIDTQRTKAAVSKLNLNSLNDAFEYFNNLDDNIVILNDQVNITTHRIQTPNTSALERRKAFQVVN